MNKNVKLLFVAMALVVFYPVMANAAVNKATSQFWKNLQAGQAQKIMVVGSSLCVSSWAKNWVDSLGAALNKSFPGLATSVTHCTESAYSTYLIQEQPAILAAKPNAIIYEVGQWDFEAAKNCPLQSCAIANWNSAIAWTHKNLPGCEIFFWTPWPVWNLNNSPNSQRLIEQNAARQIASDSGLYLLDTYWKMDSIYRTDPCYANGGFGCQKYSQYLYDGWHPSVLCAQTVIIPEILKQLKGTVSDATPPIQAPANLRATPVSFTEIDLAWDPLPASADPQSGISEYALYRDSKLIAKQTATSYKDAGLIEQTTYTYTVAGINGAGLEGPASTVVSAATLHDATPPGIASIKAESNDTIITVTFDETVDKVTSETPTCYSVNNGIIIKSATQVTSQSVRLICSPLSESVAYTLTVNGVKDLANPKNTAVEVAKTFSYVTVIPQLNYEYFEGTGWTNMPDVTKLTPVKSGVVQNFTLVPSSAPTFAIRYTGYVNIATAGSYKFYTTSDDGSLLYIDGTRIVNNDGAHPMVEVGGAVTLSVGMHAIIVDFYQGSGGLGLEVKWEGPGIAKQIIPASVLFHRPTANAFMTYASPQSAATFYVGDTLPITWTMNGAGVTSLVFQISVDGGKFWFDMFSKATRADTGHVAWRIPATLGGISLVSDGAMIQAYAYGNPDNFVQSQTFTIKSVGSSAQPLRMKENACTIISGTHHAIDVSVYGSSTYQIECIKPDGRIIAKQNVKGPATIRLSNSHFSNGMAVILIRIGKDIILKKQMPIIQ